MASRSNAADPLPATPPATSLPEPEANCGSRKTGERKQDSQADHDLPGDSAGSRLSLYRIGYARLRLGVVT